MFPACSGDPGCYVYHAVMARKSRIIIPEVPIHVVQRGSRRGLLFFEDDDYRLLRMLLADRYKHYDIECLAYCFMPNHHHQMLLCHSPHLSKALGEAQWHFSRLLNRRNDWTGHLVQDRYHSYLMDERHAYHCARYIERNPKEAGLVEAPWDWPWSSAKAHVAGKDDELVRAQPLLEAYGDWRTYLGVVPDPTVGRVIEEHLATGVPAGPLQFVKDIEARTGHKLSPGEASRAEQANQQLQRSA